MVGDLGSWQRLRFAGSNGAKLIAREPLYRGPNWAEATEGSPSVWARERYEWSGNQVVGTTQESNVFRAGGTWTLTVKPRGGAGSHIRVNFDRRWMGKGWLFSPAVALFGRQMFTRNLQKTLSVLERTGA